tara:strand:- start:11414 stop:11740 length:327 start_codon:yes stop_codon:yes gene_type:complete
MELFKNELIQEMKSHLSGISPFNSVRSNPVKNATGMDFTSLLSQAIGHVRKLQATSSDLSTRLDMGDSKVTLSDTVIAREKASVAFSATMEVRNKFVEAYKSIMSMPI